MIQLQETQKAALDAASIGAWVGALAGWLPALAAALSRVDDDSHLRDSHSAVVAVALWRG